MSMAIFSPKLPTLAPAPSHYSNGKSHLNLKPYLFLGPTKKLNFQLFASADNGSGAAAIVVDETPPPPPPPPTTTTTTDVISEKSVGTNGSPPPTAVDKVSPEVVNNFQDSRWVGGTWDLKQFAKNGTTDWDTLIDAEVKRRKWMQDTPESSSNENPVAFDTSIIPWWAWMKRFHLPEAELLNGRAAMVGFFMAYFVDSLTGVGLVDQTNNFFCKTLLFVAVLGVLLIRKNEDVEKIKKLLEETTFYDKQWQATWKEDSPKKD